MENLAIKKYFYLPDPSGLLFKGNGTGLLSSLIAMAQILPNQSFNVPIYPSSIYLLGVICAFLVHWIVERLNNDLNMRERRDNALMQIQLLEPSMREDPQLSSLLEDLQQSIEEYQPTLLSEGDVVKYKLWQALAYFVSSTCFVSATISVIYLLS